MGLLSAAQAAVRGVVADQWLEYFNCEALPQNVLGLRGRKWVRSRGQAVPGSDNIISNGSRIAVADGQCMLIVEQGRILDVCAQPGEYTFDLGTEPSLFGGSAFRDAALASVASAWDRLKFGGQPGKDARVYYFNTTELLGNKYGTPTPVPFRVVDHNIGLDVDIAVRFYGTYSYRIVNPVLFYANVAGNFPSAYMRDQIEGHLKNEVLAALQPAVAKVSAVGIRYSALPGHANEMAIALNEVLTPQWQALRGLVISSFSLASITASLEDEQMIKDLQRTAVLRDPTMAAARLAGAQASALESAAANTAGSMVGFTGLKLVRDASGILDSSHLYAIGQQQPPRESAPTAAISTQELAPAWRCRCGAENRGRFCAECGQAKPPVVRYRCDKCGWVPPDVSNPAKYCQECGDLFDDNDRV